jgi:hypothetical protein
MNTRGAAPGGGAQGLHTDWGENPGAMCSPPQYQVCISVWMLDDFTAENVSSVPVHVSLRRANADTRVARPIPLVGTSIPDSVKARCVFAMLAWVDISREQRESYLAVTSLVVLLRCLLTQALPNPVKSA